MTLAKAIAIASTPGELFEAPVFFCPRCCEAFSKMTKGGRGILPPKIVRSVEMCVCAPSYPTRALLLADLASNSSMFVFDELVFVTVFRIRDDKNSPANQSSRLPKWGLFVLRRGSSSILKRGLFAHAWSCIVACSPMADLSCQKQERKCRHDI